MDNKSEFISTLERIVRQQLRSQKVGYLLGAGSSYLDGDGYPLAGSLWDRIQSDIPELERKQIQEKLDLAGTEGIEHALDLLDPGNPEPPPHREMVTNAIANLFTKISPPTEFHQEFIRRVASRSDQTIPIFTLNYDPLFELASDLERVPIIDGFSGFYRSNFDPNLFDKIPSRAIGHKKGRILRGDAPVLHLYKLHGSMGWYSFNGREVRLDISIPCEEEWKRLMIPPQYRKASETTIQPYSALWTRYRANLIYDPKALNRLVCIGYGMRDQHVNDVIESATARDDFTLLIFSRGIPDEVYEQWSKKKNVLIVTRTRCSYFGQETEGHFTLWDFKTLCKEI